MVSLIGKRILRSFTVSTPNKRTPGPETTRTASLRCRICSFSKKEQELYALPHTINQKCIVHMTPSICLSCLSEPTSCSLCTETIDSPIRRNSISVELPSEPSLVPLDAATIEPFDPTDENLACIEIQMPSYLVRHTAVKVCCIGTCLIGCFVGGIILINKYA